MQRIIDPIRQQRHISAHRWAIYSANEAATNNGAGYWHPRKGWVDEHNLQAFPAEQAGRYALPMSLGQDRVWVNLEPEHQPEDHTLATSLTEFCLAHDLPLHQSASALLLRDDLLPYERLWLEQVERDQRLSPTLAVA